MQYSTSVQLPAYFECDLRLGQHPDDLQGTTVLAALRMNTFW